MENKTRTEELELSTCSFFLEKSGIVGCFHDLKYLYTWKVNSISLTPC